jgi:competence protein ComEC
MVRAWVEEASGLLSEENSPLMVSLLTGDKTELEQEIKADFSKSGLSHIIAVSGMHISLLVGTIGTAIALFGGAMLLRGLISIFLLLLYMAVGGFSPSIMRAGLMYLMAFGGDVCKRDYDKFSALAASAAFIMMWNPFALYQIAFWLSYLSVLGILLFGPVAQRGIQRVSISCAVLRHLVYYILSLAATTISATVFTIPVLLLVFGKVSSLGPLANILVLPVVPWAFIGAILMAVFYPFSEPMANILSLAVNPLFSWIAGVADYMAQQEEIFGAADKTYLLGFLIYFISGALLLFILGKKEEQKKNIKVGLCCITTVGLLLTVLAVYSHSNDPYYGRFESDAQMKISFLDVGQGSAAFLRTRTYSMLIDCGTTSQDVDVARIVEAHLKRCGQDKIEYVALTHYHEDHVGGLLPLLKKIQVLNLILPDRDDPTGTKDILLKYAKENHINIWLVNQDEKINFSDGMALQMLVFGEGEDGGNEEGIVFRIGDGEHHVLFSGDIEEVNQIRLAKRAELQSDVFTVPHHGSSNAAAISFLETVNATVGIISVAENNPYGLPNEKTIKKLSKANIKVFRTDSSGNINMVLYNDKISISTQR